MASTKQTTTHTKSGKFAGKPAGKTTAYAPVPSFHNTKPNPVPDDVSKFAIAMCVANQRWRMVIEHAVDDFLNAWSHDSSDVTIDGVTMKKCDAPYYPLRGVLTHRRPRVDRESGKQVFDWLANLIVLQLSDGSKFDYKMDVVHYGPRVDEVYENRGWGVYKKLGMKPVFRDVQSWVYNTYGMCLVDLSNGKQDFRLYKKFEDLPPLKPLWHGFNRIFLPRAHTSSPVVDEEGFTAVAGGGEGAAEPEPAGGAGSGAGVAEIEDDIERLAAVQGKVAPKQGGRQGKAARKDRVGH
jgi:hypothetical protein